jgi:hypothetical protein
MIPFSVRDQPVNRNRPRTAKREREQARDIEQI